MSRRIPRRQGRMARIHIVLVALALVGVGVGGWVARREGRWTGVARPAMANQVAPPSQAMENTTVPNDVMSPTISSDDLNQGWTRFRGPNGTGIYSATDIPTKWNEGENLYWSTKLPGAGSSSPILTEKHIFVTSYSGYGAADESGSLSQLKRHLSCVDRSQGTILWTESVDAAKPDDPYQGMGVPEHGYATNTPVTDGESVFVFFGKSGVIAYDMQGKQIWKTEVGKESGNRAWGTASSLVLYNDLVIVNAAEESRSIIALDKSNGKERWRAKADGLELAYGTPVIAKINDQRDDLVIAVPGEVWGLNPNTGKLVWYVTTSLTGNLSPSVILHDGIVYVFGGYRSSGSLAIRVGGEGDVTKTHVVWTSRNSSYVATPVFRDAKLYWIDDRGTYYCIDAKNGELIHRSRVSQIESRDRPVYASAIAAGDYLYFQTRYDGLIVTTLSSKLDVVNRNRFENDDSMFNATPAADSGELYLRSDDRLYCVKAK